MKKNHRDQGQPPEAAEGSRRGRFSAQRKLDAVQRLLRGESEEEVSRALGVTAATLAEWRDTALMSALASLKSRDPDEKDEETQRLKAKIGELSMEVELLYDKVHKLEAKHPFLMRKLRP